MSSLEFDFHFVRLQFLSCGGQPGIEHFFFYRSPLTSNPCFLANHHVRSLPEVCGGVCRRPVRSAAKSTRTVTQCSAIWSSMRRHRFSVATAAKVSTVRMWRFGMRGSMKGASSGFNKKLLLKRTDISYRNNTKTLVSSRVWMYSPTIVIVSIYSYLPCQTL